MKPIHFSAALLTGALLGGAAHAAADDYVYQPVAGVHETQFFHGCFDDADGGRRPKIKVIMSGLNVEDVSIQTQPVDSARPSSELITFRVKQLDASLRVQFRSKDGEHCQQGVQSIVFRNAVLRQFADLAKYR